MNNATPVEGNATAEMREAQQNQMLVTLAVVNLVSFGVAMYVFAVLYMRDLRFLAQAPDIVWDFLCGVPREDGIGLPVLILMGTVAFGAAILLVGWRALRQLTPRRDASG